MSDASATSATLLILFVATFLHSLLGFGTALVAMPLLVLTMDVQTATPLVAFVGLTTTWIMLWYHWHQVVLRETWQLVLASLVGIPVGLLMLKMAPAGAIKQALGVLVVAYSAYCLTRPQLRPIERPLWAYVFGFLGGVLGSAYNTNGPPVVLYGTLRHWSPARFRATLQGYFLPVGILIWLGQGLAGLWTATVIRLYVLALPVILIANLLGAYLRHRIPVHRFQSVLYVALIALGMILIL